MREPWDGTRQGIGGDSGTSNQFLLPRYAHFWVDTAYRKAGSGPEGLLDHQREAGINIHRRTSFM
jgi:hypothetical protein